jgi:pimeloyl-ACP methyl ester carboxylesterase
MLLSYAHALIEAIASSLPKRLMMKRAKLIDCVFRSAGEDRMKRIRVNDYDMAYIEVGEGRPLVCVHGSFGDFRTWSSVLGPLSRRHRVVALSLRHFFPEQWEGRGGRFTIAQHVSDLIAFIGKLDVGPVDLFGHSRGGHLAFRVAQQRPELLRKLILAEPGGELDASLAPADRGGEAPRVNRLVAAADVIAKGDLDGGLRTFIDGNNGEGTWDRLAASTKQEYRDNARTVLGQINEQRQPFTRQDAEAISVPTLFIAGEKTPGLLPLVLRALAGSVRGAKTVIIPGATHHMIRQDPVRTSAAVLDFLAAS